MLLTVFTTLLGIFSSIIPSVLNYFTRKQEIKYELELATLKINAAIQGIKVEAALAEGSDLIKEGESLRSHDLAITYSSTLETLRASVRPVITYTFFLLFLAIKVTAAIVIFKSAWSDAGLTIENAKAFATILVQTVFDDATTAIFGTLVGYWFGSRSMTKMWELTDPNAAAYRVTDVSVKAKKR